ncbi:MAG: radical SAM protein [Planctomycetes bacterium]|nr:radical SAM protein [Planctomycetota bacterium]
MDIVKNNSKPEVLLVQAPPWGVRYPPLSLAYLAAALREAGIHTAVEDVNLNCYRECPETVRNDIWSDGRHTIVSKDAYHTVLQKHSPRAIDTFIEKVKEHSPKVIGFTINDFNRHTSNYLAEKIRAILPESKIVYGGPEVYTLLSKRELDSNHLEGDYAVVGEGEATIVELTLKVLSGIMDGPVPGVIELREEMDLSNYVRRTPITRLDTIPFPAFDMFGPLTSYYTGDASGEPTLPFLFSRGCVEKCAYCVDYKMNGVYRTRSPQNAYEEMVHIQKQYGVKSFEFIDLAMNGHPRRLKELCEMLIADQKHTGGIRFFSYAIVSDRLPQDLLHSLKAAGCTTIHFGFETASQNVLRRMNKSYSPEIAHNCLKASHTAGLQTCINLITGFPGETEEELDETIQFLRENAEYIAKVLNVSVCVLMPGTDINDMPEKFGVKPDGDDWTDEAGNDLATRRAKAIRLLEALDEIGIDVETVNFGPISSDPKRVPDILDFLLTNGVNLDRKQRRKIRNFKQLLEDKVKERNIIIDGLIESLKAARIDTKEFEEVREFGRQLEVTTKLLTSAVNAAKEHSAKLTQENQIQYEQLREERASVEELARVLLEEQALTNVAHDEIERLKAIITGLSDQCESAHRELEALRKTKMVRFASNIRGLIGRMKL